MKNMRDLGIGILFGVALMFTFGASAANNKEGVRYQISSYGMGRSHGVYIVDTQTQAWSNMFSREELMRCIKKVSWVFPLTK